MKTKIPFLLFFSYLASNYLTRASSDVYCAVNNCELCQAGDSIRCSTCVDSYYLDASKQHCIGCSTGCAICTSSISCSSCFSGYFLNSGICGACSNNCARCVNQNLCTYCNDFYILEYTTYGCRKADCSKETIKKYVLINDLTCTDCTGVDESLFNQTYCQKKIAAPTFQTSKYSEEFIQLDFKCESAKRIYFSGGIGGYPFVSFKKLNDRIYDAYSSEQIRLKNSGFSVGYVNYVGFQTLKTYIKYSGEKYNFICICEYLGIVSSESRAFYPTVNNTMLESLIIKIKSTASLSSTAKTSVSNAIKHVLNTAKDVWINEDQPEASASSFIYTFYILPNYFTSIRVPDVDITNLMASILNNPTKFVVDVGNAAFLNEVTLTYVSALSYVTTDVIPSIAEEYPVISVKANAFQMALQQNDADGTLYLAYRISTTSDLLLDRSTMPEEDYNSISFDGIASTASGLIKQKVSAGQKITASVSGLNYNKKYTIFYYGTNNGMPKIKTLIYTNLIEIGPVTCPDNCVKCDSLSGKCQSCSNLYSLNSQENICKLDCNQDPIKKYQLITDLSCTDCKAPGYSILDASHCQNLLVPKVTVTVSNIGVVTLDVVCNSGSTFYWAYGLAQSASLTLSQVQSLINNFVADPLYYRTVGFDERYKGVYQSSTVNSNQILSNIKNSGEDYTLVAYCEYLGATSTATATFKSFKNPKLEVLVIRLTTSVSLTSSQKLAVAGAIGFVLGTKKYVWTDENKYVAGSGTRILETSNIAQFYIYPDYTSSTDAADVEISTLKSVVSLDPAKFVSAVNLKAAQPGVNLIQVTASTSVSSSSSPNLVTTYPIISVDQNSFEMILRQGGADGTLNWAYKEKGSFANNILSIIPDAEFAAYVNINLNNAPAVMDTDLKINVTGLIVDTTYNVYYYGQSYGISQVKTPIYSQIITTLAKTPTFSTTNTSKIQRLLFSCFLFLVITII